jgi:hypothetical protein
MPGTEANKFAQRITKLSSPATVKILKEIGVRYVLVHQDGYLQTELVEDRQELSRIPQNLSLKFIKSFPAQECPRSDIICTASTGPIDIYEIPQPLSK